MPDLSDYCRDIETHLCRKNDGHLLRIVGPSFEVVSRWAQLGIPLKVAQGGIDRYFERYYRKGPRRRPVKIDFCDADVMDMFDEWRRATGVSATAPASSELPAGEPVHPIRKGPSLPEHLERVLLRLSSLRATGVLDTSVDTIVDRVSAELDATRARAGGLRGEERTIMLERLAKLDEEFMAQVRRGLAADVVADAERDAAASLDAFRHSMDAEAFSQALHRASTNALRSRLGLPIIQFT